MSESSNSAWPFGEISGEEGLDIEAIFKDSTGADQSNPFASPVEAAASDPAPEAQEPPAEPAEPVPAPNLAAASAPTPKEPETPAAPAPKPTAAPPAEKPALAQPEVSAAAENPIAAAFEQKTAENTKKGLLEKPPVFYHKGVKEEIEEPSMTFEELRIRKSEDFTDLEEGKRVSWSVEYCGIRKEIKDPKGTTIISVKETIERSHEFLAALKKSKEKDPCCYVKPKVEMKTTLSGMATAPADSEWPCPTRISARFSPASHLPMTTTRLKQVSPAPAAFHIVPPASALQTPAPA